MDPHDRIHSIGGPGWRITQTQAIMDIEHDASSYYASVNGVSVWVIVADHNGNKYIKTQNDDLHPNNLLSLPECLG